MSEKQPKLKFEEEKERTATRSPPKKSKVEQSVPKKQKLKQDADKAAEKSQHLRFGKAEITPDEASRMTKQQKRAMYAAAAARSATELYRHIYFVHLNSALLLYPIDRDLSTIISQKFKNF